MNKHELIDSVAGEAIDAVLAVIRRALTAGDVLQPVGFGAFSTGQCAARNPSTGPKSRLP